MKKIKDKIYYDLSVRERIIASVEACSRSDNNEVKKLIKTCPKIRYTATDSNYSDRMKFLFGMQLAVECDLTQSALDYAIGTYGMSEVNIEKSYAIEEFAIQTMSDIIFSWSRFLEDKGINFDTMDKVAQEMRHPFVTILLSQAKSKEPIEENVIKYRGVIEDAYK